MGILRLVELGNIPSNYEEGEVVGDQGPKSTLDDVRGMLMMDVGLNLPPLTAIAIQADKFTIVDEAMTYIKTLEENLHQLEKKKQDRTIGVSNSSFIDLSSADTIEPQEKESREAFLADQGDNLMAPMNSLCLVSNPQFSNCCQSWTSPNLTLNISGVDANIFISTMKKPELLSTIFTILEKHKLEVVSTHVSAYGSRTIYMIHANASKVPDLSQETSAGIGDVYMSAVTEILPSLS